MRKSMEKYKTRGHILVSCSQLEELSSVHKLLHFRALLKDLEGSKMAISRVLMLLAMAAVTLLACCEAQVNFTPNWGKRAGLQDGPCKVSTDALMYIYKFIQSEAQKLVDCEKFGGN